MLRFLRLFLPVFLLAGSLLAGEILDNDKVVRLVKAGLEEPTILRKLDRDVCNFDLSTAEIEKLKAANVSDGLIIAMMEKMDTQVNRVRVEIEMLIQTLRTSDPEEYKKTVVRLRRFGSQAVPTLSAHLADPDDVIRAGAAEVLGEIGDVSARKDLLDALNDDAPPVRARAAKALSIMPDEETTKSLIKWIKTPGRHRDGAALALGYLREKSAIDPLNSLLDDHLAAEDDRANAAFALGLIGDPDSIRKLTDTLLGSPSDRIRETSAKAIGRIGPYHKDLTEPSAKALTRAFDRFPNSRAVVARVLADFPMAGVIATLIEGLNDTNPEVTDACYKSLRAATGETLGRGYDEWSSWWELAKVRYQVQ
ncbi:MAG: HEAT repeat domain-containing protein [Planctomycetes bacterium]|nr:HEAT repeat domain-containing protein [Planctomycetota bacterium]